MRKSKKKPLTILNDKQVIVKKRPPNLKEWEKKWNRHLDNLEESNINIELAKEMMTEFNSIRRCDFDWKRKYQREKMASNIKFYKKD